MEFANSFKKVIKEHLEELALKDELFKVTYAKENKNIDDCVKYILEQVRKSECAGWPREDIFAMAVHYYDEDDLKISSKENKCRIVINKEVQLTEEEIQNAKEKAMDKAMAEQREKLLKKSKRSTTKQDTQLSMF